MARKIEDNCVGCSSDFGYCLGASCPNRKQVVWTCDKCGNYLEDGNAYNVDGEYLCLDCLQERFSTNLDWDQIR